MLEIQGMCETMLSRLICRMPCRPYLLLGSEDYWCLCFWPHCHERPSEDQQMAGMILPTYPSTNESSAGRLLMKGRSRDYLRREKKSTHFNRSFSAKLDQKSEVPNRLDKAESGLWGHVSRQSCSVFTVAASLSISFQAHIRYNSASVQKERGRRESQVTD